MRHSTLFIRETKNRRVLSIFMPFNLFAMNVFYSAPHPLITNYYNTCFTQNQQNQNFLNEFAYEKNGKK
jgi:hypothetical protein